MNRIDYSLIRSLRARDLIRALTQDGFRFDRQRGSHHRYHHSDGRRVTVPFSRRGNTFETRTLRSIIETQAQWTEADLRRLELL